MTKHAGIDSKLARSGGLSYLEIPAADIKKSAAFYTGVLGWISGDPSDLSRFSDPAGQLIGRFETDRQAARTPGLLPFVYIDQIKAAVEKATQLGGEVVKPVYVEGNLHVAVVRDPAGNVIGLWEEI